MIRVSRDDGAGRGDEGGEDGERKDGGPSKGVVRMKPVPTPTGVVPHPHQPSRAEGPSLAPQPTLGVVGDGPEGPDDLAVGDDSDLESVYRRYAERVSRWAARLAGPGVDIEDVVHEVFLVVRRRLPGFRGDARISTWLYEITVRVVQASRRKRQRQRWLRIWAPGAAGTSGSRPREIADDRLSPLEALERRQATALLYRFLDRLDEKYRTAVVLFELDGMPCQDIAAVTGTSVSNVWARVSRGREKLLQAFARWDTEQGGKRRGEREDP
jgi:RNA polymerase sigma-70 factor (ECF subfamily)